MSVDILYLKDIIIQLGLKQIYQIFEFKFNKEFVCKYIQIRNIEIPRFESRILFLQKQAINGITCVIFKAVRLIMNYSSGS